jgi:thioredoxin 1
MNRDEFIKQELKDNEYVVVKFGAEWCGPCKQIAPVLEELADTYQDRLKYISVDVEESYDIATEYKVRNVPTILFLKQGEVMDKAVGSINRNTLIEKIETLISE